MKGSFVVGFLSNAQIFLGSFRREASEWPILGVAVRLTRTKPPLSKANPSGVLFAKRDEFLVWNSYTEFSVVQPFFVLADSQNNMTDQETRSVVKMCFCMMPLGLYFYYDALIFL